MALAGRRLQDICITIRHIVLFGAFHAPPSLPPALAKNGTIETTAIRLAGLLEREGLMDKHPEHERIASQQFLPRRAE